MEGTLSAIADVALSWRQQKEGASCGVNPCRGYFALGCQQRRFAASEGVPALPRDHAAWYAVGAFDGKVVTRRKPAVRHQSGKGTCLNSVAGEGGNRTLLNSSASACVAGRKVYKHTEVHVIPAWKGRSR